MPEDDVIVEVDCDTGTAASYSHVSLSSDLLLAVVGKHGQKTAAFASWRPKWEEELQ